MRIRKRVKLRRGRSGRNQKEQLKKGGKNKAAWEARQNPAMTTTGPEGSGVSG